MTEQERLKHIARIAELMYKHNRVMVDAWAMVYILADGKRIKELRIDDKKVDAHLRGIAKVKDAELKKRQTKIMRDIRKNHERDQRQD